MHDPTNRFRRIAESLGMEPGRPSYVPPSDPAPATREGQREIVAATLAAGMIAGGGKPVIAGEAVALMLEVRAALEVG